MSKSQGGCFYSEPTIKKNRASLTNALFSLEKLFPLLLWKGGSSFWCCYNLLLLRDLINYIDALRASWAKDPVVMCNKTGFVGSSFVGVGSLVLPFANMKHCPAAWDSQGKQSRIFLGNWLSLWSHTMTKCCIKIIYNSCVVKPVVGQLIMKGFSFIFIS